MAHLSRVAVSRDYVQTIGVATEDTAKLALYRFLQSEYRLSGAEGELPEALAAGVTNRVFGEEPQNDANAEFAANNVELITTHATADRGPREAVRCLDRRCLQHLLCAIPAGWRQTDYVLQSFCWLRESGARPQQPQQSKDPC